MPLWLVYMAVSRRQRGPMGLGRAQCGHVGREFVEEGVGVKVVPSEADPPVEQGDLLDVLLQAK